MITHVTIKNLNAPTLPVLKIPVSSIDNTNFHIFSIEGLNPPDASINTLPNYRIGSSFVGSHVGSREIILYYKIYKAAGYLDVETVRRNDLYLYSLPGTPVELTITSNTTPTTVSIKGYIKRHEHDIFSNSSIGQIVIDCPDPLLSVPEVNIRADITTLNITNTGQLPAGITMLIGSNTADMTNLRIYDQTRDKMLILAARSYATVRRCVFDTRPGFRTARESNQAGTIVYANLLSSITTGQLSDFIYEPGETAIVTCDPMNNGAFIFSTATLSPIKNRIYPKYLGL